MTTDGKSNGAARDETGEEAAEGTAAETAQLREDWLDSQLIKALRLPPAAIETPEEYSRRAAAARALRAGLGARDPLEAMLTVQMVACHDAAMGSLRDAQNQHLKDSARHTHMRLAAQLMSLFTRQLATLERHRAHLRKEAEAKALERAEKAARNTRPYGSFHAAPDIEPADNEFEEAALDRLCQRFERRLSGKPDAGAARGGPNGSTNGTGRQSGGAREAPPGRRRRG
jgi:hypothetical protein